MKDAIQRQANHESCAQAETVSSQMNSAKHFLQSLPVYVLFFVAFLGTGLLVADEYRLSEDDEFDVFVLDEDDLTLTVRVNEEGTIFFPLLGEIRVEGMTTNEVEADITRRLKGPYLVDPKVSVAMVKYREYFIGGAVNSPGWYECKPGTTFQRAVDTAGGFSEFASKKRIFAHHDNESSEDRVKVKPDYAVKAGDSLFVAESFF